MTESVKTQLEANYLVVQSEIDKELNYAIDRNGAGLHIIYKNATIPVAADNVIVFLMEILETWQHLKPKSQDNIISSGVSRQEWADSKEDRKHW